ncbi:MAG: primosomal protein N' [Candidatus Babeliales bacterium]
MVPLPLQQKILCGQIAYVPLKNRSIPAVIQEVNAQLPPDTAFTLKEITHLAPFPSDTTYYHFIQKLAFLHQISPIIFMKRMYLYLQQKASRESTKTYKNNTGNLISNLSLNTEQQKIIDVLSPLCTQKKYCPMLLHGVTGSGKTILYASLIQKNYEQLQSSIVLLPEATLASQIVSHLQKLVTPEVKLYNVHSLATQKEKNNAWKELLQGSPIVIVGVHIPILLPISNLGLIIVDEEHDPGYQEKKHPKLNTKYAALIKAQLLKIPILFGSATPSITTLHAVKRYKWPFFQLKKRFEGNFPTIKVVSLMNDKQTPIKKRRPCFWITPDLENELRTELEKGNQSILFINRRGFSFFVQCKQCSFVFTCTQCSVSLTLHHESSLLCHYCTYQIKLPELCPSCRTSSCFIKKGIGTQKLMSLIQILFPHARVERLDKDSTRKKQVWQNIINRMHSRDIDILIGTQSLTKGYHFPHVTLVGIVWADLNLNFPFYSAAETTLQQLIQVAGRAGRKHPDARVIVQTMIEHEIFQHLNEIDYLSFYKHEIKKRENAWYPPASSLAEIEIKHTDETQLDTESLDIASTLLRNNIDNKITILGPTHPPIAQVKKVYSRKIYCKSSSLSETIALYQTINKEKYTSAIFFTPHPLTMS